MIVDVHHHYLPKRYFEQIADLLPPEIEAVWKDGKVSGRNRTTGYTYTPAINPSYWHDADTQLRCMDAAGVDHAVLSSATYQDWMTPAAARIINDGTAELVARHPDRFSGMISVPQDGGEKMVAEILRARDLGLCALNMTTTHSDRYPDDPAFRLFLETASETKLPVFVHPSWCGPLPGMNRWNLERTLGKPTDMALGIANLLYGGSFKDLADLRMCFGHLGGSLPITLRRMFLGQAGYLNVPDYDYRELLQRVYVDTAPGMWQSPLEIEATAKIIGMDQTLLGSDYPLGDPEKILGQAVDHVRLSDLPEDAKQRLFASNAIELFGLHHLTDHAAGVPAAGGACC